MNVLLGKYLLDIHFTREDCSSLQGIFRTIKTKDIEKQFQEIIQKLLDACCKGDIELKHYLCQNLGNMAVRVKNAVEHDNLAVYLKVEGEAGKTSWADSHYKKEWIADEEETHSFLYKNKEDMDLDGLE